MNFPRPQTFTEIEDIQAKYGLDTVYRMSHNESAYGPSPQAQAAIQKATTNLGLYPPMGDEVLRRALAEVWGRGLTPDNFFTGCSGYESLELLGRTFIRPGDEVIVLPPSFGAYNKIAAIQGGKAIEVPLTQPDFQPDIAAILAAINDKTRMLILCNPNNPTGTIMPAKTMETLMQALPEHVLLVSDEVYFHFVQDAQFPDSVQYVLDEKNIVLIHSFSKAYGMAGLRLGYGIAKPEIANQVGGLHRGFHQNRLALAAGVAALADQDHLQKNVQVVLEGKTWLYEQFDQLDLSYWPSQTNFLMVELPGPAKAVAEKLLAYGVMVRAMDGEFERYLRVSLSTPEANAQFIKGLSEIL